MAHEREVGSNMKRKREIGVCYNTECEFFVRIPRGNGSGSYKTNKFFCKQAHESIMNREVFEKKDIPDDCVHVDVHRTFSIFQKLDQI